MSNLKDELIEWTRWIDSPVAAKLLLVRTIDRLAKLEKVASVAKSLKTTSYMRLANGTGRFLIDEHDWYAFREALHGIDVEGAPST